MSKLDDKIQDMLIKDNKNLKEKNMKLEAEKAELIGTLSIALDDKKRKLYKSELIETLNKFKESYKNDSN